MMKYSAMQLPRNYTFSYSLSALILLLLLVLYTFPAKLAEGAECYCWTSSVSSEVHCVIFSVPTQKIWALFVGN
jgi:uncharacterized membrane protein